MGQPLMVMRVEQEQIGFLAAEMEVGEASLMEVLEVLEATQVGEAVAVEAKVILEVLTTLVRVEKAVEAKSEYGHGDLNEWTCKRKKLCDK